MIALLLLVPSPAGAQSDEDDGTRPTPPAIAAPPLRAPEPVDRDASWQPKRTIKITTADYFVTGAGVAGAFVGAIFPPRSKHVRGGVLADEDARDFVRLESRSARYQIRDASDVGVSLLSTWPFLVDALISAWWYRGDAALARKMAFMNAEAFALVAAVQGITTNIASRERPYGRLCGTDQIPNATIDCEGNVRYRSFFSGHATLSFTSAALLCSNHLGLGLLGAPWDVLTCATSATVAGATALFRMMGDMHYLSDVTVGAVFGTTMGLLIPWLHWGPPPGAAASIDRPDVRVAPVNQGLGLVGTF